MPAAAPALELGSHSCRVQAGGDQPAEEQARGSPEGADQQQVAERSGGEDTGSLLLLSHKLWRSGPLTLWRLQNMRVVQRNLVYVVGLSLDLCSEDTLRTQDYFGQFGRIVKVRACLC